MKFLAILLSSLWIKGCFAGTCASNNTVDLSEIITLYTNGANCVPEPIIESGDDAAGEFRDAITGAIGIYGAKLLNNILCQAIDTGDRYVSCIKKTSLRLQETIKSHIPEEEKSILLIEELEQLTNQLKKVLDLKPGNVLIKRSVLSPIPEQQVDSQSRTTKRTPKELFLEFDAILNSLATNVFGYITAQFLGGWHNAKSTYNNIRSQIRDKILNDKVLAASRIAVDKVYECKDIVRKNVLPETWQNFKDTAGRIIEISNDYNASKNGEETCSLCTDCTNG